MLRRLIRYSCIYEARMTAALNGSSAIQRFKHSNAIKIHDGITFDFYTGLPHVLYSTGLPGFLCFVFICLLLYLLLSGLLYRVGEHYYRTTSM